MNANCLESGQELSSSAKMTVHIQKMIRERWISLWYKSLVTPEANWIPWACILQCRYPNIHKACPSTVMGVCQAALAERPQHTAALPKGWKQGAWLRHDSLICREPQQTVLFSFSVHCACFSKGVGLNNLQGSLPTLTILDWLCAFSQKCLVW